MADVTAVKFKNKQGHQLFGIFHESDAVVRKEVGIILLSPGVKMRVAPHRMYLEMTERFIELGFPVLRFDFYGLGDSEGEIDEGLLADLYGRIQTGMYVDDTVSALDWMQAECGLDKFIVGGLCGGAITGLLCGMQDRRIDSLLGIGIPVTLDSANMDRMETLSSGYLERLRKGYVRKLLDPRSWLRLLTFQSDFRVMFKSLQSSRKQPSKPGTATPEGDARGNYNHLFTEGFMSFVESSRRMLLVYGGADRLLWEFEEQFMSRYAATLKDYNENYLEFHKIENANHILSLPEWKSELLECIEEWLRKHY